MEKIEELVFLELDKRRENSIDLLSVYKNRRKRLLSFRFIRASFRDWRE